MQALLDLLTYQKDMPFIFNSGRFLFFFSLLFSAYGLVVGHKGARLAYLTAFSLLFYYISSGSFVFLLLFCILFNFFFAQLLPPKEEEKSPPELLTVGILVNLSFLLYYKYANFFIGNLNALDLGLPLIDNLVLPVGISFFTFQTISYLVDVRQGKIPVATSLLDFAFYLSFFPQLVAGPIVRAIDFLPQLGRKIYYRPAQEDEANSNAFFLDKALLGTGLFLILKGLLKKALLADYLGQYVDLVFSQPEGQTALEALLGIYAYTVQIYGDFSGYSDMAIGIALLLGFELPDNFHRPYRALNITDFWRRWHISLSSWLRDYIYIPLGGNRKGPLKQYLFLMITMLVGGFWHGASWAFVFWGGMHGLGLMLHKAWKLWANRPKGKVWAVLAWVLNFHFVAFLWVYFRMGSFEGSNLLIARLFTNWQLAQWDAFWLARPTVLIFLGLALLLHLFSDRDKQNMQNFFGQLPWAFQALIFLLALILIFQFQSADVAPFIYFQF